MSSLGFIAKTFKPLEKFLLKSNINCNRLKQKMCETAVRGLYYIYTGRTKEWNLVLLIIPNACLIFMLKLEINMDIFTVSFYLYILLYMPNKLMGVFLKKNDCYLIKGIT